MEDMTPVDRNKLINDQQFLYNSIKKQSRIAEATGANQVMATGIQAQKEIEEEDEDVPKYELVGSIRPDGKPKVNQNKGKTDDDEPFG